MIRVNCKGCINFTGTECRQYGDDPVKAAKNCAYDGFVEYIPVKKRGQRPGRRRSTGCKEGDRHGTDRNNQRRKDV